jgi:hypothetical protein
MKEKDCCFTSYEQIIDEPITNNIGNATWINETLKDLL